MADKYFEIVSVIKQRVESNSICFLRDGRIVSGCSEKIFIYDKDSYETDIIIEERNLKSVCGLKDGNLASGGTDYINIWDIDGNNHKNIYTYEASLNIVRIIEVEDGKLWCANYFPYREIVILDDKNAYKRSKTLLQELDTVKSVLEVENRIVSIGNECMKIWDKSTYECVETFNGIRCLLSDGLAKLKENTVIVGGTNSIVVVDTLSRETTKSFKNNRLGIIFCVCVLEEDKVLLVNYSGNMLCYDPLSNQIISTQSVLTRYIYASCVIKSEDDKIFLAAKDCTISIYDGHH